ncbi:transcriptional repressor, CopY family [Pirellula staleyi DSM 6068]|uniref:Transcriptional repressor, CopY family n=1 Tax=Pirellula staleyi (strain ATCC 27377 / DSM 6068 / ICPB 4128) TaxID=530564 RepID=D2QZW1_PIRSD|nr:BlaI/MecI/CopY family transcriptional regulator [Pirellula staleyi]ADB16594.1 transcriptional repressor, CopY family [Pirellula staleyi DSM 6068]
MPRPKEEQPTPAELEVLKVIWNRGASTVREVMDVLNEERPRAYTSVMSLLNVMADKGLLRRIAQGRAFLYEAAVDRQSALQQMVGDLLGRVFEGSTRELVAHMLDQSNPSREELDEIRKAIREYQQQRSDP